MAKRWLKSKSRKGFGKTSAMKRQVPEVVTGDFIKKALDPCSRFLEWFGETFPKGMPFTKKGIRKLAREAQFSTDSSADAGSVISQIVKFCLPAASRREFYRLDDEWYLRMAGEVDPETGKTVRPLSERGYINKVCRWFFEEVGL